LLQEVVGVENFALIAPGLFEQLGAIVEADRAGRANESAGRPEVARAALGAEVAFSTRPR
jgi:hypothetical protein